MKLSERVYNDRLNRLSLYRETGKLLRSVGIVYEGYLPGAAVGSVVNIVPAHVEQDDFSEAVQAEVIGFKDKRVILMPLDDAHGVSNSSRITLSDAEASIPVGEFLLGRVIGGKGEPLDGKGPLIPQTASSKMKTVEHVNIYGTSVNPLDRVCIEKPLDLGVRALNGLLTCGKGQRVGIMAGSGVGKSVLLGMMSRYTSADINIIALIGERGREVREFIERDLGPEGLSRSVVIVVTNDKSPLLRRRGAFIASTIAEYFCNRGQDVLLLMDSVTRFAMAQREIGLSMGEPPASKGYTPSVFSMLPKLLERAGTRTGKGSITGLYTVLVEGDDMDEPIADATRSILDGHIVLSRQLASRNHYPAIDVLGSVSRVMNSVISEEHLKLATEIRDLLAIYSSHEDLINIGAYVKGTNLRLDQAISIIDRIRTFLKQGIHEATTLEESISQMRGILKAV